jgi:hypothetical protein
VVILELLDCLYALGEIARWLDINVSSIWTGTDLPPVVLGDRIGVSMASSMHSSKESSVGALLFVCSQDVVKSSVESSE